MKFAGQSSCKWSVRLLHLLIAANARGLRGGFGGTPIKWHAQGSLEVTIKRERGVLIGINKLKIINVGQRGFYFRRNGEGQEVHCRWDPYEGKGEEHFWNCRNCHRRSGPEDYGEACLLIFSPPPPKQWWTPITTAGLVKWTKETLCSYQSLLTALRVGPASTF